VADLIDGVAQSFPRVIENHKENLKSAEMEACIMNHRLTVENLDVGLLKASKIMTMSICNFIQLEYSRKEDCIGRYLTFIHCVIGLSQVHRQGITQGYQFQLSLFSASEESSIFFTFLWH